MRVYHPPGATRRGHLPVLPWQRQPGCPCSFWCRALFSHAPCPPEPSPCGDKFIIKSKAAAQIRGGRCGPRGFRDETLGAEHASKEIGSAPAGALCRNVHLFLNCYQLMCPLFPSASSPSKAPEQRDRQIHLDPSAWCLRSLEIGSFLSLHRRRRKKRQGEDLEIFPVDVSFSQEMLTGPLSISFMKVAAPSKL